MDIAKSIFEGMVALDGRDGWFAVDSDGEVNRHASEPVRMTATYTTGDKGEHVGFIRTITGSEWVGLVTYKSWNAK